MTNIGSDQTPPIAFLDDPHAPETFATEATGFFLVGGNVAITFASMRVNHEATPGPVNRVVSARIVLPLSAAQQLVVGLNDFLEKQGVSPSDAAKGGATPQ